MKDLLKGNFQTKEKVGVEENKDKDSTEDQFERAAMRRLGGSICFVAKKRVKWAASE